MSSHAPVSVKTYVAIYVALLLLTLLTLTIGKVGHLGVWEIPVALGIAAAKTILVGLFFMHLIEASKLTWLILFTGVLFLSIMLIFTLADYWTRPWWPVNPPV